VLILRSLKKMVLLMVGLLLLAGCNFNTAPQGEVTPTIQAVVATDTAAPTDTLTPLPTALSALEIESATPTATAAPPTETPTPSSTPGPYEHTIKEGDSLISIVAEDNYTDFTVGKGGIIDQVVSLNGLTSADILPPPGSVIYVPRQTATPTPENNQTAVAFAATDAAVSPNITLPPDTGIVQYTVAANDTIVGIAEANNLTLGQIVVLNPQLEVSSCNFAIPSGGPDCVISIQVGEAINLPAPTPTMTLSPTPNGSETATPTPTHLPPMLISPPDGATISAGVFSLQWVGVGILLSNEFYLVEVTDTTSGAVFRKVTKDTALLLPDSLIPTDGQTHVLNWTVRIATPNDQGVYRAIGGEPEIRAFNWQSR
jgi:LysM repeat protein